ncbi:McrB family protein [Pasteurella canis]|uniref:McrB family protein n=1 Tax=Pasteurella canis TaxID=753 RepID=UPI00132A167E|nr:AAA family ATPase [Pasteurella canis]MXN88143.1 AAA domain-containing protein [Pasteurella canis]
MQDAFIQFNNFKELVGLINKSLGDFCEKFAYTRKILVNNERVSQKNILFAYRDGKNNAEEWAINKGGGTEIQYHLFFSGDALAYGLAFSAQYVPFNNDKTPVEFIKPFVNAYFLLENSDVVNEVKNAGFKFIQGNENKLRCIKNDEFYLLGKRIKVVDNNKINVSLFQNMIEEIKSELFDLYCEVFEKRNELIKSEREAMHYIELLENNKNLILTGAPGTGKTYLAKKMAIYLLFGKTDEKTLTKEEQDIFKEQYCFVQFHPSYDYTDFVEGLRAETTPQGQVSFTLKNGIFKEFCKKALSKASEVRKSNNSCIKENVDNIYDDFAQDVKESDVPLVLYTPDQKRPFIVKINRNDSCDVIAQTEVGSKMPISKEYIKDCMLNGKPRDWKSYVKPIIEYIIKNYYGKVKNKYIFVIDEINRGEISKIFGELFFTLDPGYRGVEGKVKTQYANIQQGETIFDESLGQGWFYIPENVYIIGTMNDIDRSVESIDFAMRRRFVWQEVKANERIDMWDGQIDAWKVDATKKMQNLNEAIENVKGLSSAYHIGPAYFLKLSSYQGNFEALWNNHIYPVLSEYLRGYPNADEELAQLKQAYDS